MKTSWSLIALLILAVGAPSAFAKKPKGEKKGGADVFSRYDKNTDGKLDAEEIEMLKKAFASDPDLKKFDTNSDGKLDDNEIAAIKPAEHKKKKKKNA